MTMPRDMSFPERFARIEQRIAELEMLTVGRPSVDPSDNWTAFTLSFIAGITSLGSGGVASGFYRVSGGRVTLDLLIQIGSGASFTADEIQVGIPFSVVTNVTRDAVVGSALLVDNSTTSYYPGACVIGYLPEIVYALDLGAVFRFYFGNPAGDAATPTSPITLAQNDLILAQVTVPGTLAG